MNDQTQPISVLIVDDEELVRELMLEALQAEDYEALSADRAEEARRLLESHPFDVLLTDINLATRRQGIDLAAWATARFPSLKIIFTSGDPAHSASDAGAWPFIQKPFRIEVLLRMLEDVTGRLGHASRHI